MQLVELEHHELPYEINEELKVLRTNLQFCGTEKKVIMLTSTFNGEGKSTISLYLARSITELGKRVLLIDADMRKSVLEKKLIKGKNRYGLSHFLSGQCTAKEPLCQTENENMMVFFAGEVPPNPAELLARESFRELLDVARSTFDYVIVDSPPLGMVVDATVIAQHCDGAIIVMETGKIHYRTARDVVAKLNNTHCPVLGAVLNKVDWKRKYYGSYDKRYGYYKKNSYY